MQSELLGMCLQRLDESARRATASVDGVSPIQADWKPAPKSWSINECLEHMNIAMATYLDRMAPAIERARNAGMTGHEPYGRGTWPGRYILGVLHKAPGTSRVPAPGIWKPAASSFDKAKQLARFVELSDQVRSLAEAADGLALGKVKVASPASRLIRVTLAQAFEILGLHNLRHTAQLERVSAKPGYPQQPPPA